MNETLIKKIMKRASNPKTIHDMAEGLSPKPSINEKITIQEIEKVEKSLGFKLPDLLKQIYTEIGNGGFGPGYGLLGTGTKYEALENVYSSFLNDGFDDFPNAKWKPKLVPICTWGCGIYSCIDCSDNNFSVFVFDPETHVIDDTDFTITDVDGNVISLGNTINEKPISWQDITHSNLNNKKTQDVIPLKKEKNTFEEWITAWADGVFLWEEIEKL